MINPRSSNDALLKAAMSAWDKASPFRDAVFEDAMHMRNVLRRTTSHQAYGWATLTCGRIAAHRQDTELAEVLLAESLGRLYLVGDSYGENMAISHLALPHILRQNLDRALELALRPLSSNIAFSDQDKVLIHSVVSQCYWAREEPHQAILHLMNAYDLVSATDDFHRKSAILGNIGTVLETLGEWDLAIPVLSEAWRLQLGQCTDQREIQLTHLANLVLVNCQLEKYEIAVRHAELLFEYLNQGLHTATWSMYESMVSAFAFTGQVERAQHCLNQARVLKQRSLTPFSEATTLAAEAILLEARKDYAGAAALAKRILESPVATVMQTTHRYAANILARCCAVLGRTAEAAKWRARARGTRRDKLLDNILSSQLRTSLNVEQPIEPLTERELMCLYLAARGQTSADIALKLGIKTRTVNFHFAKILRKLNALNRQEAIAKAISANLLRDLDK